MIELTMEAGGEDLDFLHSYCQGDFYRVFKKKSEEHESSGCILFWRIAC